MELRSITASDRALLERFLYLAIHVPDGEDPPPPEVIRHPEVYRSVDGFGTVAGDLGRVALDGGVPVGACWARRVPQYGFVDTETPSLALSVVPERRGEGIGTRLLQAVLEALRTSGARRVSLSVAPGNRAARLYRRMGFRRLPDAPTPDLWIRPLDYTVRPAVPEDLAWLEARDHWVSDVRLGAAVRDGRVAMLCRDGVRLGWLRWGYFWDELPNMHLLRLVPEARGQGYGTQLVQAWEAERFAEGAPRLLTATQADEPAQHFYRRLGYRDSGVLLLPGQAAELILVKGREA